MRVFRVVLVIMLGTLFLTALATGAARTMPHAGAAPLRVSAPSAFFAAHPLPRVQWSVSMPRHGLAAPPGNFPFQTTTSTDGNVIVHYYNRPADFGQQAISTIEGYLQHPIEDTLGFTLKHPVNIYIYANRADFLAGAQPTNAVETGAYAIPSENLIYLPLAGIPSDDADSYLPHELTHIVFHQNEDSDMLQGDLYFYPKWLDEGLAEHDVLPGSSAAYDDAQNLVYAVGVGTVYDLFHEFDSSYPTDPVVNTICYAEASSFISYLIKTFGATAFHHFIAALPDGEILLAAEQYFGADLQTLQNQWRASIGTSALALDPAPSASVPAPLAYTPGHLGGIATQTKAIALAGQDQFSGNVIRIAFLLTLVALIFIAAGWFQLLQRQRRVAAVRAAEMFLGIGSPMPPSGPPLPGYGSNMLPGPTPSLSPSENGEGSKDREPSTPIGKQSSTPTGGRTFLSALISGRGFSRPRLTEVPRVRWWEMAVIAAVAPVVLITQLIAAATSNAPDWSQSLLAATVVSVIAIVVLAGLAVLALVQRRLTVAQIGGLLVAVIILIGVRVEAGAAGLAQGKAYEDQGAYALAVRVYTDAGAPGTTLGRVQNSWAQADIAEHDDAEAVIHLRAAAIADPGNVTYRTALLNEVNTYGQALTAAQQFALAESAYTDQAQSSACDALCRPAMQNSAGHVLLAWADILFLQGNQPQAMANVQQVIHDEPRTDAGTQAQAILTNLHNPLSAALTASAAGQYDAMNILLQLAALQNPGNAIAAEAAEVPVEVSGTILDSAEQVGGQRAFFVACASQSDAQAFLKNNGFPDPSILKFATTINADGSYTVRLAPGYWYLVIWSDATRPGYFHFENTSNNGIFAVVPFATQTEAPLIAG